MKFTEKQIAAIQASIEWYFGESYKKNIFVIAGFAGTGKSTILSTIINVIGIAPQNVIFTAFTGKAALVLRMKGLNANTIHKTFYNIYKAGDGRMLFSVKKKMQGIQLIVVDELSMVSQKMMDDILSFGIPVIALGDPGQLPPIYGNNNYITKHDAFLTEVMRTDDKSGILTLSTLARSGKELDYGVYGNSEVVDSGRFNFEESLHNYDVILCWRNKTRVSLNRHIRKDIMKIESIYPIVGDKVLCLQNNYNYELDIDPLNISIFMTNGLLGTVEEDTKLVNNSLTMKFFPDFNKVYTYDKNYFDLNIDAKEFEKYGDNYIEPDDDEEYVEDNELLAKIDYGYTFTVHKSQGSEWNRVLVLDEFKGSDEMYNKWLYTAITRAKEKVTVLK